MNASKFFGGIFDDAALKEELGALDHEMQQPGFWDNPEKSKPIVQKRRAFERKLQTAEQLDEQTEELATWRELSGRRRRAGVGR